MQIIIEVGDEQIPTLKAKASAEGLSLEIWAGKLVAKEGEPATKSLKSVRGMWKKYGPAPSAEEIDENRREMFRNFPRDID